MQAACATVDSPQLRALQSRLGHLKLPLPARFKPQPTNKAD